LTYATEPPLSDAWSNDGIHEDMQEDHADEFLGAL
jgi:hypothetical protein